MVKARIYVVRLLDFINSIAVLDNIQDGIARTVGRKMTFSAGGGVVRPLRPPLVTGLYILLVLVGTCEYSNENVRWWKASFSHDCDICCFAVMRLERQVRTQQDS